MTNVLFSIHPNYAQAIYEGIKTVELRTRPPTKFGFERGYIYETSPVKMITRYFIPARTAIFAWYPEVIIEHYGPSKIIGRKNATVEDVRKLLGGRNDWCPIEIKEAHQIKPIALKGRPPQSWRYCR